MAERLRVNGNGNGHEPGILIVDPTDQSAVQPVIRGHAEVAKDWEYAEQSKFLYRWAGILRDRLLDPIAIQDRKRLPDPVISFERMRIDTLASYSLVRNPQGLLYEITMNARHILDNGQWRYGQRAELETLLHEQVHLWQQNFGDDPVKPGKVYHNREFVDKCESLGLHPKLGEGYHTAPADGVFAKLMDEYGIPEAESIEAVPPDLEFDWFKWLLKYLGGDQPKGKSTLSKWECPECKLSVRVGVRRDIRLLCGECEAKLGYEIPFVRSEK
jgi:hypothetical protein